MKEELAKKKEIAKNQIKISGYYSPLALKRMHFDYSDEWRTHSTGNMTLSRVLAKKAVLKTEFMVMLEGVMKYPTAKFKQYLIDIMTKPTTLKLTEEDENMLI